MKTKSNIIDVAKHAGVSMKTVSRVINNESSVKQKTRDIVMASVKALNYTPNASARSLRATRSYSIGYIYDNLNAYYVIDMQNGILNSCRDNHFELLIHPLDHRSENLKQLLTDVVTNSRLAGVILTPPFSEMSEVSRLMKKLKIPFVNIVSGNKPSKSRNYVYVDDRKSAYNITQHLIDLGHERIAFLSGEMSHHSSIERLNGYHDALKDNGIKPRKRLVIDGQYSFESGVEGTEKLLGFKNKPTAIFASNDEIAAGAVFQCRLQGVAIPQQISIVGFENSPYARQTRPKLTTADQPNESIAEQATNLLISQIQGWSDQQVTNKQITTHFSPQLLVRESTSRAS